MHRDHGNVDIVLLGWIDSGAGRTMIGTAGAITPEEFQRRQMVYGGQRFSLTEGEGALQEVFDILALDTYNHIARTEPDYSKFLTRKFPRIQSSTNIGVRRASSRQLALEP